MHFLRVHYLSLRWWICANLVFLYLLKMCPKCCMERSASVGKKINYYMQNIYISITIEFLEAVNFNELTLIQHFFVLPLVPLSLLQGCWQLSCTIQCGAFGCS